MPTEHLRLKRKASGYYYCSWMTDAGRRRTRGFGNKRAQAERRFAAFRHQWTTDPAVRNPDSPGPLSLHAAWERFEAHAKLHYRRADGTPTGGAQSLKAAFKVILDLQGDQPAAGFSARDLKACQAEMVKRGLALSTVNERSRRIRHVFKWLAGEELVPAAVWSGLQLVRPLEAGRCAARVTEPVRPVADEHVWALCRHLPPALAAMVRFQYWTGCRPAEVCDLRPMDLDTSGPLWLYRPAHHKSSHRGRERVIIVGPRAQEALRPYLGHDLAAPCFTPAQAVQERRDAQVAAYQPPEGGHDYRRWPSYQRRRRTQAPARCRPRWDTHAYGAAIRKACKAHGIPHWSPNQLRHAAATRLRRESGLDVAQIVLGHARADVTQVYAEVDLQRALTAMAKLG